MSESVDVLIFLQNPWSRHYAGKKWDGLSWERALWASRTGTRLKYLLAGASLTHVVRNCNPIATRSVHGCRRPDPVYVRAQVAEHAPRALLLCGQQARFVTELGYTIPTLTMPHPTWRLLSNKALDEVRGRLDIICHPIRGRSADVIVFDEVEAYTKGGA